MTRCNHIVHIPVAREEVVQQPSEFMSVELVIQVVQIKSFPGAPELSGSIGLVVIIGGHLLLQLERFQLTPSHQDKGRKRHILSGDDEPKFLEMVLMYFDQACKHVDIPKVLRININSYRDDRTIECFPAYRAQPSKYRLPVKRGTRFDPNVNLQEIEALASLMILKCACARLPFEGVKREIRVDAHLLPLHRMTVPSTLSQVISRLPLKQLFRLVAQ